MIKNAIFVIFFVVLLLSSYFAYAVQANVNVYDDSVYSYLDKLAASKLIKTYSPNQRPLTRFVVAKLIVEATSACDLTCTAGDKRLIEELDHKFSYETNLLKNSEKQGVNFVPINDIELSWTATDQPESAMPANGLGTTGGKVQPLLSYKNGQHYEKYANAYFDTSHYLNASPYFSAYIQPQGYGVSGEDSRAGVRVYRGYLKGTVGDLELQVGRDDVKWGPGENSLMFSDNFKGLDMLRLTTPSTFRLPWLLKYLGQWRFTTFFALLGRDYSVRNTILSAYRIDYQPFYWLDIGFDHAVMMGGRGAHDPSASTAVGEYVGFIFKSGNSRASSNHQMGLDLTARIPQLLGMELYGKLVVEDTQKEYYYMYVNDASWLGGIYFPKLDSAQKLSLRSEFIYTGQFAARHSFYSDGFSLDGKFMGYDSGSDTYSVATSLRYQFNFDEFVRGDFRYLYRSSNTYAKKLDASGDASGIYVTKYGPKEQHYILKVAGQKRLSKRINLYGDLGLDRTINKGFESGHSAVDFAAQIKFIFHDLSTK